MNASGASDETQPSITSSSSASCTSTVPLPARKPSTNAAPTAGGVPADERARQPRTDRRPGSTCRRRAAGAWPGPAPARARRRVGETGRAPSATRRAGPDGRPARAQPARRLSRSTIAAAASSSSDRHAMTEPGEHAHDDPVEHGSQRRWRRCRARRRSAAPGRAAPSASMTRRRRDRGPPGPRHGRRPASTDLGQVGEQRQVEHGHQVGQRHRLPRHARARQCVAAASTRGAVSRQLDDADRQLRLPDQPPRLAERAAAAAALLDRAPRHAERAQAVQQTRTGATVRARAGRARAFGCCLRLQPTAAAGRRGRGPAAPAGRRRAPRRSRRRRSARRSMSGHAPGAGHHGVGGVEHLGKPGRGRSRSAASAVASASRGDEVVGRGRHSAITQQAAAPTNQRATPRSPGWWNTCAYQPGLRTPGAVAGGRASRRCVHGTQLSPTFTLGRPRKRRARRPWPAARLGQGRHVPGPAHHGDPLVTVGDGAAQSPGACALRAEPRDESSPHGRRALRPSPRPPRRTPARRRRGAR